MNCYMISFYVVHFMAGGFCRIVQPNCYDIVAFIRQVGRNMFHIKKVSIL